MFVYLLQAARPALNISRLTWCPAEEPLAGAQQIPRPTTRVLAKPTWQPNAAKMVSSCHNHWYPYSQAHIPLFYSSFLLALFRFQPSTAKNKKGQENITVCLFGVSFCNSFFEHKATQLFLPLLFCLLVQEIEKIKRRNHRYFPFSFFFGGKK